MAIRPPRAARRRRRSRQARDVALVALVALVVTLFGARALLATLGVDTWTVAWKTVDLPTGLLIDPLERVAFLGRSPVSDLTIATLILAIVAGGGALFVLGTLANERE